MGPGLSNHQARQLAGRLAAHEGEHFDTRILACGLMQLASDSPSLTVLRLVSGPGVRRPNRRRTVQREGRPDASGG